MKNDETKKGRFGRPKAALTAPLFVLALYALLIGARYIDLGRLGTGDTLYLSLSILQLLILVIPTIIFCRIKGTEYTKKLNVKLFSPAKLGYTLISAVVMVLGSTLIRLAQVYIIKRTEFSFALYDSYLPGQTDTVFNALYAAIAFAVIPAVTEELIFRGIVLTEYNEGGYGGICAAFVSSVLFSMIHFSLRDLVIYLLCGFILAIVVYNTQSVLPAMIAHLLYNLYGLFAEGYIIKLLMKPSSTVFLVFALVLLFLLSVVIMLGAAERMNLKYAETGHPTPSYKLKRKEDGKTPDVASSTEEENPDAVVKKESFGESVRLTLGAVFSPTFLLCIVVFVVAALKLL